MNYRPQSLQETTKCQSPVHDPDFRSNSFTNVRLNTSLTVSWCSDCMDLTGLEPESDPTMRIFRIWAEKCGPTPSLPESLRGDSLKQANLVQYLDAKILSKHRKDINKDFPVCLKTEHEKDEFIRSLEQDMKLSNFLPSVNKGTERKNIALRMYAGGLDASLY
jgi:hypothetical protein